MNCGPTTSTRSLCRRRSCSGAPYELEPLGRELDTEQRRRLRALRSRPIAETLRDWPALHRQRTTDGTALARAIDFSQGRRQTPTRHLEGVELPADHNWIQNRIRPVALRRATG